MKKNFKRIFAIIFAIALVFALSGCSALDDMRQKQAFYKGSGEITWNGEVYKALPASEYLQPEEDYSTWINLTDPDVPVLLQELFRRDQLRPSTDGDFLINYWGNGQHYCKAELYDDLRKRISEPFSPEIFCYRFERYVDDSQDFEAFYYALTQEQTDRILQILQETEPRAMGAGGWWLESDWVLTLEESSKDFLFRLPSLEIAYTGQSYYILAQTEDQQLIYPVPEKDIPLFDDICADYIYSYGLPWDIQISEDIQAF